uniref:Uncharacterized protein n=1 Tax=Arundo donax TaxID=35708 RepID=A0A0A9DP46_ARUDO
MMSAPLNHVWTVSPDSGHPSPKVFATDTRALRYNVVLSKIFFPSEWDNSIRVGLPTPASVSGHHWFWTIKLQPLFRTT